MSAIAFFFEKIEFIDSVNFSVGIINNPNERETPKTLNIRIIVLIRGFSIFSESSNKRLRKETECIDAPLSDANSKIPLMVFSLLLDFKKPSIRSLKSLSNVITSETLIFSKVES